MSDLHGDQTSEDLYRLSDDEQKKLKNVRRNTLIFAGLAGAIGVIALNLPHYIFEEALFPIRTFWIPVYEGYIDLEIEFLVYGLVLVLIEIWFLTYLNIRAVKQIAKICGYPGTINDHKQEGIRDLIAVSLDQKQNNLEDIGIDPYEGMSNFTVSVYQIFIKLKATVSGMLFKLIVKRILGRYAIRYVVELAGIPVYAFWNMYASQRIMNEARVRVLAPPLIERFIENLHKQQKDNEEFKSVIYHTLQSISRSKRSFHFNHYLLAVDFLRKFEIEVQNQPKSSKEFLKNIDNYSEETRKAVSKLLVFGILLDGRISLIERRALKRLQEEGVLEYSIPQIRKWSLDFFNGKGLEELFND